MMKNTSAKMSLASIAMITFMLIMIAGALFVAAATNKENDVEIEYRVDQGLQQFKLNESDVFYISQVRESNMPDVLNETGVRADLTPVLLAPNITETRGVFNFKMLTTEVVWSAVYLLFNNTFGSIDFST